MIGLLCLVLVFILILQFVFILIRFGFFWKDYSGQTADAIPSVSVLIAARNEEKDLPNLLCSLESLDYPEEKLQFLFADDQSTDNTPVLLKDWCSLAGNRKVVRLETADFCGFHSNGKANALHHLSLSATGEYLFFTDADCIVPSQWIRAGVSCFGRSTGMVLGITQVSTQGIFAKFQELDWWNTLGFVKAAGDLGIPTTGLGNNMAISRRAYSMSGGFRELPDTLTEDLEIAKTIRKSGLGVVHQVSSAMLVKTKAERTWVRLLEQRKRWMSGVMTLPWYWLILLGLQFLYYPAWILLCYFYSWPAIGIGLLKMMLQAGFIRKFAAKSSQRLNFLFLMLYDIYAFIASAMTILYYFWPSKIKWKSRVYP